MPLRALAILLLACQLAGCASRPAPAPPAAASFTIEADAYERAFGVAKDLLLDSQFELERIDARSGVIVTRPRTGAGLLAPWTIGSGGRLLEDTLNAQVRVAEVRFEPAEEIERPPDGVPDALADPQLPLPPGRAQGAVVVSVRVLIGRRVSPTHRLDPTAIRSSSSSINPRLFARGLSARYTAPHDLDARASAKLARAMQRRLGMGTPEADRLSVATGPAVQGGRGHADSGAPDQRRP